MSSKPFNRRKESVRIRNGLVSAIHAMVTTGTVLLWLTQYTFEAWNPQRNMGGGFITPNNANGDAWLPMLVSYTVGYFTYDTICMMVYPHVASVGSYVHHIAIGLAMACGLTSGIGRFYHFIFLWEEISTLPLNLKALNRHRPAAHKFYSGAFVVLFMLSRGVIGLSMSAATYYCIGKFWLDHHVQMNSYLFTLQVFLQFVRNTSSQRDKRREKRERARADERAADSRPPTCLLVHPLTALFFFFCCFAVVFVVRFHQQPRVEHLLDVSHRQHCAPRQGRQEEGDQEGGVKQPLCTRTASPFALHMCTLSHTSRD